VVTENAYQSFEGGDVRRDLSIIREGINTSGDTLNVSFIGKFTLGAYDPYEVHDWGINRTLLRYTEILLMKAECINELSGPTGEAVGIIDQIRNRAGLAGLTDSEISDKTSFFQAIVRERRHELMFENNRWFDLVRWGMAEEVVNAYLAEKYPDFDYAMQSYQEVYPIPYDEIVKVGDEQILGQNPGW
jgi:hypothetical protein